MAIRIPTEDPVVVPAVAEKTYPDRYVTGFAVKRQPGDGLKLVVETQAYNFDSKEMSENPRTVERFVLPDLKKDAQRSSIVSQALNNWRDMLSLLYRETYLREKLSSMGEGAERDALIVKFHNVQTQLGVVPLEDPPPPFTPVVVWAKPDGNTPELPTP